MFIVQPASAFGDVVREELASMKAGQRHWQTFELAVAWVNRSGAEDVKEDARAFLAAGGSIYATVGLDFGSTTYEGLGSLLDLESTGATITTHVFCDENPSCTFHPKVFLFRNVDRARLFVGSNNMTGAGLGTNVEAALGFSGALDEGVIGAARQQLAEWRNEADSRVKRLTRELLEQLRDRGYVLTEEELRDRRRSEARSKSSPGRPLFGRSSAVPRRPGRVPSRRGASGARAPGSALGDALLMRVRPRRNGNQVQISMKVLEATFMKGAKEVVSVDGSRRAIGYNLARGVRNTARFEAPEMMGMKNPVARFRWVATGILQYEILDADSDAEGARIIKTLEEGISTPPVTKLGELSREATVLSTPDRAKAQWYRLDSD